MDRQKDSNKYLTRIRRPQVSPASGMSRKKQNVKHLAATKIYTRLST
jgi:hypothetical protein